MRYIKMVTAFSLIGVFQASPAVAADWAGFYAGITIASKTVQSDWTTTKAVDPSGCDCGIMSDPDHMFRGTETGAGPLVGYNWNLGNWIVGVEASTESIQHHYSIDDRIPGLPDGVLFGTTNSYVDIEIENGSPSLRLRGGYLANPDLLLYVVAETAELEAQATSTCVVDFSTCININSLSHSKSLSTTALGFGLERAVSRFLIRVEYLDADFGDFDFTALADSFDSFGAEANLKLQAETIQLGASYEF